MAKPKTGNQLAAGETALRARQRQKLIDACISALHLHGPSRTTIDKVVAIADMSPGIVNFYFETKAALLLAALEYLAVEFEDRVMSPVEALRADPVQALERLVALYLDPEIASPRKVSVWYAFWGEASSRREYQNICGKRDQAFADLVRDLMARLIAQYGPPHLDADAVALGLIGALEMIWQEIAFHDEAELDRAAARRRCMAYLGAIFPGLFSPTAASARAQETRINGNQPAHTAKKDDGAPRTAAFNMLVAAELTLAGLAAQPLPPHWPGCGVIVRLSDGGLEQVLVVSTPDSPKQATHLAIPGNVSFDWLAVLLPAKSHRWRCFISPRAAVVNSTPGRTIPAGETTLLETNEIPAVFARFENNFSLSAPGAPQTNDQRT